MRRLTAGLVIFALVVKVGSEAFTDLFTSATRQAQLPVCVSLCASAKYASLRCSFAPCSSKVWAANRLSTQEVSRASPRTIKVAAAIPAMLSIEMLTA